MTFPVIRQLVLDTTDPRGLAEFYRQLFDLAYRPGDGPPQPGTPDPRGADWLVLRDPHGGVGLAFQAVGEQARPTWPDPAVPQQVHLDCSVEHLDQLRSVRARALELGATVLLDRTDDREEPLYVFADPAGHPFCVFVG